MSKYGAKESDLVAQGFHRLDKKLMTDRPPRIKWGLAYQQKSPEDKIQYLEKLAAAMNHAAFLIQNERNALGQLCEQKEAQLTQVSAAMVANTEMVQTQIIKMNADRQEFLAAIARLKARVRELENGDHD